MRTCRECRWLTVAPDRAGRRVVRRGMMYACAAPLPHCPLPHSVTEYFAFNWPPRRTRMAGDGGDGCPTWEVRG